MSELRGLGWCKLMQRKREVQMNDQEREEMIDRMQREVFAPENDDPRNVQLREQQAEITRLSSELEWLNRKIEHGCHGFVCIQCDEVNPIEKHPEFLEAKKRQCDLRVRIIKAMQEDPDLTYLDIVRVMTVLADRWSFRAFLATMEDDFGESDDE